MNILEEHFKSQVKGLNFFKSIQNNFQKLSLKLIFKLNPTQIPIQEESTQFILRTQNIPCLVGPKDSKMKEERVCELVSYRIVTNLKVLILSFESFILKLCSKNKPINLFDYPQSSLSNFWIELFYFNSFQEKIKLFIVEDWSNSLEHATN